MFKAIRISEKDNVATVIAPVEAGQQVTVIESGQVLTAVDFIKAGHKMALVPIAEGENAVKYGVPIGRMKSGVPAGGLVHVHNLQDITEELCSAYCKKFREAGRMINAFPRKDGTFGIRNYIMVISTAVECNAIAEAISDGTGCAWMVCDKTRARDGRPSDFTRKAMAYTGRNPNVYAALVVGPGENDGDGKEIHALIAETGKPVGYLALKGKKYERVLAEGISAIEGFKGEAARLKREPVSLDGFSVAVHCSGSDWTTALTGNTVVGLAADQIVKNGGVVLMDEWEGFPGSEHLLAEQCVTRKLGLKLLDHVDAVRATVLRETGKPIEAIDPHPKNIEAGITTLVEKSAGTIKKAGSTDIQGILEYCEAPTRKGVWLPSQDSLWPCSTAIYGALSGAHLNILVTGLGYLYFELPHMPGIRLTGNPQTFREASYKLDFNAGIAFEGVPLPKVGEMLFEYLLDVAEGKEDPRSEQGKLRAFNMFYYTENEFSADNMPYCKVTNYAGEMKAYIDAVK